MTTRGSWALAACLAASLAASLVGCGGAAEDGEGGAGGHGVDGGGGGGGGTPAPTCDPPTSPPPFAIGTGELCFTPISEGSVIPQINGPQGGYHLWLAVGCSGCVGEILVVHSVLHPSTMQPVSPGIPETQEIVALSADAWPQAAGIQMPMPGSEYFPEEGDALPAGTPLLLRVSAYDPTGGTLLHQSEVAVVLGEMVSWDPCDTDPTGPCCDPNDMCLG